MPTGTCPECEAEVHVDTDADKGVASLMTAATEHQGTQLDFIAVLPTDVLHLHSGVSLFKNLDDLLFAKA